ncbi:molybdenum cofactor biosysynthesis protein [Frondihabitans sp. 4ASC-45]|uniref:molybdenum cofactor biosysynthesis protein n=1 Tax=Frondihabitans sp. 4ASC-45 TaxID=3111636 RepID=UPI003C2CCF94
MPHETTEPRIPVLGIPTPVTIEALLASPRHRYAGRPGDGALPPTELGLAPGESESRTSVTVRGGLGIVGDRYFGKPAHRAASVTLFDLDALDESARELGLDALDPLATRRNVLLRGVAVDQLRGAVFTLDSGSGPVAFRAGRPANPCAWMDHELAPGAFAALRGRGGMRCEPLADGVLHIGAATFVLLSSPVPPARRQR